MAAPEKEPFAVAVTASAMSNYKAELLFDGETQSSGKKYRSIYSGISNGTRVLCARVSGTWVILGPLR